MNNLYFTGIKAFVLLLLVGVKLNAQQWDGLTLYSNSGSSSGYLIDTNSTVIKTFTFTGGGTGYSTHMTPGGFVWRSAQNTGNVLTGGGMTGKIQKYDYNSNLLWSYTYSSSNYCLHHDHCPLPNGNVLVISYDVKTQADLSAVGGTNSTLTTIWSEKVMELKPVGTNSAQVVWEWKVWDHLVQNVDPLKPNYYANIVDHPELLNINYLSKKDWIHMNGIDYNPMLDQIVVSSHNLNEWYVIDHSTTTAEAASHTGGNSGKGGDILYRWGNPLAYQATGTKILNVTHDAHWIPEGVPNAGYLVGVNNQGASGPKTTIDQINPPLSTNYNYTITPSSAFTPTSYLLRHTSTGYTSNMGSSDQFPNGNQMVCLATAGTIYEIDPLGNIIWSKSTSGSTPQAHRYSQCFINNAAPATPSISLIGTDLVSTTGVTYQWYLNGILISGATSQTYTPTQQGVYVVRVTDSNGCVYVYSAGYKHTTGSTGVNSNSINYLTTLYPNPTNGKLTIHSDLLNNTNYSVLVTDALGKSVITENNKNEIDLSSLNNGIYYVTVKTENNKTYQSKVSLIK